MKESKIKQLMGEEVVEVLDGSFDGQERGNEKADDCGWRRSPNTLSQGVTVTPPASESHPPLSPI